MFFDLQPAIPKGRNTFCPDIIMKMAGRKKALHNWFIVLRHVLMGHSKYPHRRGRFWTPGCPSCT
jgi:hypothetical protein